MVCSKCKKEKRVGRVALWFHQKAKYEDATMVRYEKDVHVAEYFICKDCITKRLKRLRTFAALSLVVFLFMLIAFGVMALGDNEMMGVFIFWAVLFVWALAVFLPIIVNPFRKKLYDKAYNGTMRRMIEFRTWWNEKSAYSKRELALVWERMDQTIQK